MPSETSEKLLFIPFLLLSAVASAEECDSIAIPKISIEVRYTPAQTLCIDKEPRIWTKTKETHAIAAQVNITPTENDLHVIITTQPSLLVCAITLTMGLLCIKIPHGERHSQ